ncbi:MAG: exo-beta-N-acetylmuramidase NamZ domain-containing protein [Planctomycetota bacterium]
MTAPVETGLEVALREPPQRLRDARAFGLLSNQASVTRGFGHATDALHGRFPETLRALFGPQHGLWSTEQDNMIETAHATYRGLPVHSLYSETRRPTDAMLDGLDLLVVDLQDVGTRVYTYAWTLTNCMRACAERGVAVMVLDRPNPLGGVVAEGARLDPAYESFVGGAQVPMRHGLTLGELARHCDQELGIGCELHVTEMRGWRRDMLWADTGLAWVPPSPNLPRHEGALVYPGQVLLEGTNLSEGRGTTTPFEQFGAPWLDPRALQDALGDVEGAALRPVAFEPTFQKYAGQPCRGLYAHVTEPRALRSYALTLRLLRAIRRQHGLALRWNDPPYEYEDKLLPIDILAGGDAARRWVDGTDGGAEDDEAALAAIAGEPEGWWTAAAPSLLYPAP